MSADNPHRFFPTPVWFAEQLLERYFADLGGEDIVCDAGCGTGAFLSALDPAIDAYGVEIDKGRAEAARIETGREIVEGDFSMVPLPRRPTVVIGNPPFKCTVIDRFLARAGLILPEQGRVGWIVPTSIFQTSNRVNAYREHWSIDVEQIPRDVFHRLRTPLAFAVFRKDDRRRLVGLALYQERADWHALERRFREILSTGRRPIWRALVAASLDHFGGEASLQDIYRLIAPNRPTGNQFWREKVRQTCAVYFSRTGTGTYALRRAA